MIGSAIFELDRFAIDGFRVDAVASMLYLDYGATMGSGCREGGDHNLEAIDFLAIQSGNSRRVPHVISMQDPLLSSDYQPRVGGLGLISNGIWVGCTM